MAPPSGDEVPEDPQSVAMQCAATLWADDACSRGLGIVLVEVVPGRAVVEMTVDARMVNGHGIGHGGMIFTLADSAFAIAANSRDRRSVAHQASVTFLKPVALDERLRAEAVERTRSGRSGICDVTVTNAAGEVVAEFRGLSRETGGAVRGSEGAPLG